MAGNLEPTWPDLITRIKERTPARVLVDRAGGGYLTGTQLELRQAHAAARDAVRTEFNLERDLGSEFVERWNLFEVSTLAKSKDEYLMRPDLGRKLNEDARRKILARCHEEADLQIVMGDGLSVTAVATQVPRLLPALLQESEKRRWKTGQPFAIHYCRVGIMNEIGELLRSNVIVLLIGERPGLATAESLSAYMAFRPKSGDSDAKRNLISNIHARGVSIELAVARIINLASLMIQRQLSGVEVKEEIGSSVQRVTGSSEEQNL